MTTAHKIVVFIAGATLLVALGVVLAFWTFRQIDESAESRIHIHTVLSRVGELLSALKDAEIGERGYLLTGDEEFLKPYLAVVGSISGHLDDIRRLTFNPAARLHLDALVPLVNAKITRMAHNIELRRGYTLTTAQENVRIDQGKRLMDSIRAEIRSFTRIEEDALAYLEAEFQTMMRRLFSLLVTASLLSLLSALTFAYFIDRETKHRLITFAHLETKHLLEIQQETNKQLQQANLTLQSSEGKLAVTLNSIGDAVIATDVEGRVTLMNPVAEQLTGWPQAEAAQRPVDDIFHIINQKTREPSRNPVTATLADGTKQGMADHVVLISRDGRECAIADSCAPIRHRDGQVVGSVLVFRDVTEENAAQQALCDSNALVQAILNTVADGIITFQAGSGIIETVNPAVERMFGYATPELIGQPFSQLIPEHAGKQGAGDEVLAVGPGREVQGRRKDGSVFPLEIAVSEMWPGGRRSCTGVVRDITARKLIEAEQIQLAQRLRDLQFYTRSLFESNIDALMTTDPSGTLTDVNHQMELLTGSTRAELIGAPFKSSFTDPERAETIIRMVLSETKVTDYELTARARDGKETVVSVNAATLNDRHGVLQGVFAAARDITERRRLDQVLREKNIELESARFVAEKANLAKSEFLSSMSHELRSPLNAILGFAQLMECDSPLPTPAQKESITQILRAGWHLLKLIDEILDLAKVEAKQIPMSEEPVSLAEVMLECRAMTESQAQQHGIGMTFPQFDRQHYVLADRTRLKQVLLNLLSNAIKYNRRQGAIVVECTSRTPERTRIGVRDTGDGLAPEKLAQLFQPFNRLGQEGGGEEGTGIGLVVAKRLVELMRGTIGVESAVGVGSLFWFELATASEPRLAVEAGEAAAVPQPAVALEPGHHKLLYVEDNPANMKLVEQIVTRHPDISLLTAVNGNIGLEIAHNALPKVILMDINLPGINGFEVLKILRSDPKTAHIPVIAISANAMPLDIERGLKAGFFRYITKPIKVKEFMEALNVALAFADQAVERR